MNIDSILLSEYASLSDNNQSLTVFRTFNHLIGHAIPAAIESMCVSLIVHGHEREAGTTHMVELRLINQRRETVVSAKSEFTFGTPSYPGLPLRHMHVARFVNAVFPQFGLYAFEIYIDETYHASASFALILQREQ
ncbi:MAG: DUF6941 family protein [Gemmatimonadota bacterium]